MHRSCSVPRRPPAMAAAPRPANASRRARRCRRSSSGRSAAAKYAGRAVSDEDLKFGVVALSAIFFVIDPLATAPIFLTITSGDSADARRRTAARAAFAAWVTMCVFAVAGGLISKAFGISLGAFKIAGGVMLLLMSIDMMRAQPS